MEVDEKPTEDYNDIGGLEKQASLLFFSGMHNERALVLVT